MVRVHEVTGDEPRPTVTYVGRLHSQVFSDLSLNGDVPVVDSGKPAALTAEHLDILVVQQRRIEDWRNNVDRRESGIQIELCLRRRVDRWILSGHAARPNRLNRVECIHLQPAVDHAESTAHDGFVSRFVGDTNAGSPIPEVHVQPAVAARAARTRPGAQETQGALPVAGAGIVEVGHKGRNPAILLRQGPVQIVAHAIVDRQARRDLEVVLRVESIIGVPIRHVYRRVHVRRADFA